MLTFRGFVLIFIFLLHIPVLFQPDKSCHGIYNLPDYKKGTQPFFCNNCGLKFSQKASLVFHIRHECGRYHVCICGAKIKRKRDLMQHMRTKHPEKETFFDTMYTVENGFLLK